jgi:small subunit ribosomal protein S1
MKKIIEIKEESQTMKDILSTRNDVLKVDDVIEGHVLAVEKSAVFIDLKPYGTGIIYGLEFLQAKDIIKKLNVGFAVKVKVVELENEKGYIEVSLREAREALVWTDIEEAEKTKKVLSLPVVEANSGGLMFEYMGILGFLPTSQLAPEHFPKVTDKDKDKITSELKKLIGKKMDVIIMAANSKDGKLIFTEKKDRNNNYHVATNTSSQTNNETNNNKYEIGNIVEGVVTGVVDFGLFIKLAEKTEGLVHISEISWSLVENPRTLYKAGERIRAKIIDVKEGKISLSIKGLTENPWVEAANRYKKGQKVSGVVIRFSKHGALISLEEGVTGLMHISEFGGEENMKKMLSLGKICHCYISNFEPKEEKMTLVLKEPRV